MIHPFLIFSPPGLLVRRSFAQYQLNGCGTPSRKSSRPSQCPWDAAVALFPPATKINAAGRFVKILAFSKGRCNFQITALHHQLAPNQRPTHAANCGLRNRWIRNYAPGETLKRGV